MSEHPFPEAVRPRTRRTGSTGHPDVDAVVESLGGLDGLRWPSTSPSSSPRTTGCGPPSPTPGTTRPAPEPAAARDRAEPVPRRLRLDAELVRRGLARSREHASELIAAGRVKVAGAVATKPATGVTTDVALVVLADPDRPGLRLPRRAQAGRCAGRLRAPRAGVRGPPVPRRRRVHRRVHRRAAARRGRGGRRGRRGVRPAGLVPAERRAGRASTTARTSAR